MQISKTQQSPNFGMALKTAPNYLERKPKKFLNQVTKAIEELKNTKYYNLEIDKNGNSTIVSRFDRRYICDSVQVNKPVGKFLAIRIDKEVSKNSKEAKDTYGMYAKYPRVVIYGRPIIFKLNNTKAALESYEKLTSNDHLERDVELTKLLDKSLSNAVDNILLTRSNKIKLPKSSHITIDMH